MDFFGKFLDIFWNVLEDFFGGIFLGGIFGRNYYIVKVHKLRYLTIEGIDLFVKEDEFQSLEVREASSLHLKVSHIIYIFLFLFQVPH